MIEGRTTMLGRAVRRRCPQCNFSFEREEGYWVGALIANIAAAEGLFAVLLVIGIAATYPDTPWTALTVAGAFVMVTLPIVFYPLSKMLWLWLDLAFIHPVDADDLRANDP